MKNSLLAQKWFGGFTLSAASKVLFGDYKSLKYLEKMIISKTFWHYLDADQTEYEYIKDIIEFFCYSYIYRKRSKSQIQQDNWILYMTKEKRQGYFVEFGACDGILLSNTFLLEKEYGWKGILAEPDTRWHENLQKNRNCHISTKCVSNISGDRIKFLCAEIPELSRIYNIVPDDVHERTRSRKEKAATEVETISLLDLLDKYNAPKYIDYLSIDTEGSEYEILKGFDFSKYKFGFITVEHAGEESKREKIRILLERNGYYRWFPEVSRWDDWYILKK